MADISGLGELVSTDPIDTSTYKRVIDRPPFPKRGFYTLQVPEAVTFDRTKAGNLKALFDPTVVGPIGAGLEVRFNSVSTKTYMGKDADGNPKETSQAAEFAASCGFRDEFPGEPTEQADLLEALAGSTFRAVLDWETKNKRTGQIVKGMENFPSDGNGGYLPYIEDKDDVDEKGRAKRYRANLRIAKYLAR